jgi:hypothetical protein
MNKLRTFYDTKTNKFGYLVLIFIIQASELPYHLICIKWKHVVVIPHIGLSKKKISCVKLHLCM